MTGLKSMISQPGPYLLLPANLVPASAAVPAASTQQKQYKHDDKKCGEIHSWPPWLISTSHAFGLARTTFRCDQLFHCEPSGVHPGYSYGRNFLLTKREPLRPKRQGVSVARPIPMRVPQQTSILSSDGATENGHARTDIPS